MKCGINKHQTNYLIKKFEKDIHNYQRLKSNIAQSRMDQHYDLMEGLSKSTKAKRRPKTAKI